MALRLCCRTQVSSLIHPAQLPRWVFRGREIVPQSRPPWFPSHTICPITASDDAIVMPGRAARGALSWGQSDVESDVPFLRALSLRPLDSRKPISKRAAP